MAAWHDAACFTDCERAALAPTDVWNRIAITSRTVPESHKAARAIAG